jgi:hypothetical protein
MVAYCREYIGVESDDLTHIKDIKPHDNYSFLAENTTAPLIKYRDNRKKRIRMGMLAIAATAIMAPSSVCFSAVKRTM